jgi:hypothetical protein
LNLPSGSVEVEQPTKPVYMENGAVLTRLRGPGIKPGMEVQVNTAYAVVIGSDPWMATWRLACDYIFLVPRILILLEGAPEEVEVGFDPVV